MAFDESLARRVRNLLGGQPGITERRMFGGIAFMVDGRMFVGISQSALMARVGVVRYADALAMPNVREMDFTGRPMKGYVYIDPPAVASDADLSAWVLWCLAHARALSAKAG